MKKNLFVKIAVSVLSLVLLIGAIVGITVSANESTEPEIIAQNIVYGDKVSIAYAVKADISDAISGAVGISYYWSDETAENAKKAVLLDTTVSTNLYEGKYPVFVTEGVPAKNLDKVAFAAVAIGEAEINEYSHSYSAVQYLYSKLYREGYVNKTEADGLDFERKALYENLLAYGASAQSVLINGKANTDADKVTLITDYSYAYTNNEGVTINGGKALLGVGVLEITAAFNNTTALSHTGWNVTYLDGTVKTFSMADAITVDGVACFAPVLEAHTCVDADNNHFCDTCLERVTDCADTNEDGRCDVCKLYSFEYTVKNTVTLYTLDNLTDKNLVKQDTVTTEDTVASYYGYAGQLITDPHNAANKVLQVLVNDGKQNSQTSGTVNNVSNIKLTPNVINEGGKVHVIEYDFNLMHFQKSSGTSITDPFSFYAYDKDGNKLGELQHHSSTAKWAGFLCIDSVTNEATPDLENNYHFGNNEPRTSSETEPSDYAMFDAQRWYRFRFIWDEATNALYFDVSFDEGKTWHKAFNGNRAVQGGYSADAAYIQLEFTQCWQMAFNYLFDDISYTVVDTVPTRPDTLGNDSVEFPSGR